MAITASLIGPNATDEELKIISDRFENESPETILRWTIEEFEMEVALATGFGAEGCVLVDMLARINPRSRMFFLDTGLLFPETYELCDRLEKRYGVRFERRTSNLSLREQAAQYGEQLWERQPDECCRLRKVEPLRETLAGLRAWITAIRRDQSPARTGAGIVERDAKFNLIKINPLARWSSREVWNYIFQHDVPYNTLHDQNYPSIGCLPCTTPVGSGEDPRSGRWRGSNKTECGLHK